jgi:predicted AAA+ superfamily ATPase
MAKAPFKRQLVDTIVRRVSEPRSFIQIVVGPRQTGKTTAILQAIERMDTNAVYFSFDEERHATADKLRVVWGEAREAAQPGAPAKKNLLVLDEIQRVGQWSSTVKALWDEDTRTNSALRVVLSGSSPLLLRKGLKESLAGRFEVLHSPHWSLGECMQAFDYSLEDYLFFGGYPGAARIKDNEDRWAMYMREAIIEPTLTKDVLLMDEVRKPAVLTELFYRGAAYSSQEVSYRKLLGQLQDAGNTDTIANYLRLLGNAGILKALFKYDEKLIKARNSSPRLLTFDPSLMAVASGARKGDLLGEGALLGHVVESAVGAYLLARSQSEGFDLFWWRDGDKEVDFVIRKGAKRTAIEVKSGRVKSRNGIKSFLEKYPGTFTLLVGSLDYPLEDFLLGKVPLFQ